MIADIVVVAFVCISKAVGVRCKGTAAYHEN